MKKFLTLLLVLISVSVSAQESLLGSWNISMDVMGTDVSHTLTFDNDTEGTVTELIYFGLDIKMLGAHMSGKMTATHKGHFELKNNVLTIKWMPDTVEYTILEKPKGTMKGKTEPELQKQAEKMFDDIRKAIINENPEDDIYDSVTFKRGKLILKSKDKEGKTETETYTRVSEE